jgi:hypothetical protein
MVASVDPETGRPTSMNLMADARAPTLAVQAADAAANHLQIASPLTAAQVARIVDFERQVYTAQVRSSAAGSLVEQGGPPAFGPRNLAAGEAGVLGNNTTRYVFPWAACGPVCLIPAATRRSRGTPRVNRSRAATTSSCSARSGSETRCT